MKIPEPATVEQERAVLRTLSVRRLGYACLILMALVSRDVVAQTPSSLIQVVFQTRSDVTIQAPRDAVFSVRMRNGMNSSWPNGSYVCRLPDMAEINARYLALVAAGGLRERLDSMESAATRSLSSFGQVVLGLASFMGVDITNFRINESTVTIRQDQLPSAPITNTLRNESAVTTRQDQPASGPFTHTYASRCLTVLEAQNLFGEIRRGIRAELNLPAPTSWNR